MSTSIVVASAGKAARLKPELRLAEAVSQFRLCLSNEQKTALDTNTHKALQSVPDASHVIRFTAEFNDCMADKAKDRCYGPRLSSFLQGVQQFAALGDVIVGGSQNIVACGVWSLVRMSLLAIVSISAYLEALSNLFMEIGRTAPRHQAIAILYPRSDSLRAAINEYFIVVVNLCKRIFEFSQKTSLQRLIAGLNIENLKCFRSDLDQWANYISAEVGLLMATRVEAEAQESSKFRAFSMRRRASAVEQQKVAQKIYILDQCSVFDYETSWKQLRKIGNTTSFAKIPEYHAWRGNTTVSASTLVLTGKLGCGKSVVFANMIEDLVSFVGDKCAHVAYFFCRHDIPESLMARTILGSLIRQILCKFTDFPSAVQLDQKTRFDYDDMVKLFGDSLPSGHTVYFVIDGLDACSESERSETARELRQLQAILPVSLCISYRLEPDTDWKWIPTEFPFAVKIAMPGNSLDIESYIQAELERCLENRSLVVGDPTLILDIQDALSEGAQGMFLWASLQLKALCLMRSDEEIRQTLINLPQDLRDLYSHILNKSKQSQDALQQRLLELMIVAKRPLTVEQMREALSVTPGDTDWQAAKLLNDIYTALSTCGALLTIDEEELTVRVVHPSVTQFLLGTSQAGGIAVDKLEAEKTMADVLVTYLSYGVFGTELSATVVPRINAKSMPSHVMNSALSAPNNIQKLALKLLKSRRQQDFDVGRILAQTRPSQGPPQLKFQLYEYAKAYCLHHILSARDAGPHVHRLLPMLLNRKSFDLSVRDRHLQGANVLHIAAQYDNAAVFEILLGLARHEEIEQTLLSGYTPLMVAADAGSTRTAELLLATGKVNINAEDLAFQTSLICATGKGHLAMVELLARQPNVRFHSPLDPKRTALTVAIEDRHDHVLEYLLTLEHGFTSDCYANALRIAIETLNRSAVEILLRSGRLHTTSANLNWVSEVAEQSGVDSSFTQLLDLGEAHRWDLSSHAEAAALIEQTRLQIGGGRERRNAIVDWHMFNS